MIFYDLVGVLDDGTPNYGARITKRDKISHAESAAKKLTEDGGRIAVIKVTRQHLGTYGSRSDDTKD